MRKKLLNLIIMITISLFSTTINAQTCDNITNAGEIFINELIMIGQTPSLIRNYELPSGGDTTKEIEYIWLMTIDSNTVNGINWNVTILPGGDSTYQYTDAIYTDTWFRRCSRRNGCSSYVGETSWLKINLPNSSLPITNIEFTGYEKNNRIYIHWKVNEVNVSYFDIYCNDKKINRIYSDNSGNYNYNFDLIDNINIIYFNSVDLDNKETKSPSISIIKKIIEPQEIENKNIYLLDGRIINFIPINTIYIYNNKKYINLKN